MLSESRDLAHQTGLVRGPLLSCRSMSPRSVLSPQSFGILIALRLVEHDAGWATINEEARRLVYRETGEKISPVGCRAAVEGVVSFGECFSSRDVHSLRRCGADELSTGAG